MNKISQLLQAPNGYECTGVEGSVKKIFDRTTFTKGRGGSVQKVILERGGQDIKVALWNRDEFPYGEGTIISLAPTSQGKGLTIKINEYQGRVTNELNVGDKASVVQISEYSDQTEESAPADVLSPEPVSAPAQASAGDSALPAIIIQQANLMDVCIQGAQVLRQKYPNMTDDQFQAITSSFFIESNKQGVGKSMPTRLL